MRPIFSALAVKVCLAREIAAFASVSEKCPGVVVENSMADFCRGSDFLPATSRPISGGDSRKSNPKLFALERLAFASSPPLEISLEHLLPRRSPDRVRNGGSAFTPASWLLPCWLRPSHWEIFSLMLMTCSWEGGLPDCRPCQTEVASFCKRSTSPTPRLPCSSLRASMLRGGKFQPTLSFP